MRQIVLLSTVCVFLVFGSFACKPKQVPNTQDHQTQSQGDQNQQVSPPLPTPLLSEVQVPTPDGISLAGAFVQVSDTQPSPTCLLLHQLGADEETYSALQEALSKAGISSLAIDFRGHGASTQGAELDYHNFTDEEWASLTDDVKGGLSFLRSQPNVDKSRLCVVGASIGANLAIIAVADDTVAGGNPPLTCMVLLSPGVNYHSVQPLSRARDLGHMPVLIVSGTADAQSYGGSQSLSQAARGAELMPFNGRAHGTDLFKVDAEMLGKVVDWIKTHDLPGVSTNPPSGGGD
jgi:dienelactone hydrolase